MKKEEVDSEKILGGILNTLNHGVYIANSSGKVTHVNEAFIRIFGYRSPEDLVGKRIQSLYINPDNFDIFLNEVRERGSQVRPYYTRAKKADGTTVLLHVAALLAPRENDAIHGTVTVVRPVTSEEIRALEGGPKIFISYSHCDGSFAEKLASNLKEAGIAIWLDKWEIDVGESVPTRIEKAIRGCDFLIAILTRSSVQSEWFRRELDAASIREIESRGTIILPVLKENCDVPALLASKRYADFRSEYQLGLDDLVSSIQRLQSKRILGFRD